jgi:hypothetical protein
MNFSMVKKISPYGWVTLASIVLILASVTGIVWADQANRAAMEACSKSNACHLNPQFAEMEEDAISIDVPPGLHNYQNSSQKLR